MTDDAVTNDTDNDCDGKDDADNILADLDVGGDSTGFGATKRLTSRTQLPTATIQALPEGRRNLGACFKWCRQECQERFGSGLHVYRHAHKVRLTPRKSENLKP